MKRSLAIIALLTASGCATAGTTFPTLSPFERSEVAWFSEKGANTIRGSALLRQQGGGVVTCAGNLVTLVPNSTHTAERMAYLYGSREGGYNSAGWFRRDAGPLPSGYREHTKEATCDAQGFFVFRDLPDGVYYVTSTVVWEVTSTQGGALMKRVEVRGGQEKEIVLNGER